MVKKIFLKGNSGKFALVDDHLYESLSKYNWYLISMCYAYRAIKTKGKQKNILMHREIMGAETGVYVDHINGDGLDNRMSNLRFATPSQNSQNSKSQRQSRSIFKGVGWHKSAQKWRAVINLNGKSIHIGYANTEYEAAILYDEFAINHFGEFACLNFPKNKNYRSARR